MPELMRYGKPGATVVLYDDHVELTVGFLWSRKTHSILLRAITGVSVEGLGGPRLRIETMGESYVVPVGVGAAEKLRRRILEAVTAAR